MSDIFFQPLDETRMKACVQGVAHGGMSVVIHCPQLALLNYYGDIFLRRLKEELQSGEIENYNPSDADVLIENFNQMVSEISVQQALQTDDLSAVKKVWVVRNAHIMEPHEVTLLGQLIQQFPGAKVRVILWVAGQAPDTGVLSAFGNKLKRWDIPLPNVAQTKTFWHLAKVAGTEKELRPMLDQLKLMAHVPAALKATREARSSDVAKGKAGMPPLVQKAILALGALALLMASTALVAWMYPDKFASLQWQASTSAKKSNSEPLKTEVLEVELPDAALVGRDWAEKLPEQGWVVLHGPFPDFETADQVKKSDSGLKNSQVVPVYMLNEPLASFVIASGPFEGLQDAKEFNKLSPLPNPGSTRTSRHLKSRLNPTAKP